MVENKVEALGLNKKGRAREEKEVDLQLVLFSVLSASSWFILMEENHGTGTVYSNVGRCGLA